MLTFFASHMVLFIALFVAVVFLMCLNFALMARSALNGNDRNLGNGFMRHILLIFLIFISFLSALTAIVGRVMQHYGQV